MRRAWIVLAAVLLVCTACGKAPITTTDAPATTTVTDTTATTSQTTVPTEVSTTTVTDATTTTSQTTVPTEVSTTTTATHAPKEEGLVFELPLRGATGFISVATTLYSDFSRTNEVTTLSAGDAFTILEAKEGDTWRIRTETGALGYVENITCYLNIADVIPSIVLDNTNSYASAFLSSGKALPDITGKQLYDAKKYNPRLNCEQFLVACNWQMVQRIYVAQQAALAEGYTLVINEAFRPMDVQLNIAATLKDLYNNDAEVKAGIDTAPWNISWFIANRPSTHQMGCAIDTSLAKVTATEERHCGNYRYRVVTEYTPCVMPTPIHELSAAAVSLAKPVNSYSLSAWKDIAPAKAMTESALLLKTFCTEAGMSPLASEWWHFNDLHTKAAVGERYTTDPFYLDTCLSELP